MLTSFYFQATLCYCDEFCDQHNNPDCCPDYKSHCKGVSKTIIDPMIVCQIGSFYFTPLDPPPMDNCNLWYSYSFLSICKHLTIVSFSTCVHNGKVCENDTCLSDLDMIYDINSSDNLGWTARNYTSFYGRKLTDGLMLRLGTFEPPSSVKAMSRLSNKKVSLPERFNSLESWPGLISEIPDQEWCG